MPGFSGGIGTPEKNPTEYVGGPNRKQLCPPVRTGWNTRKSRLPRCSSRLATRRATSASGMGDGAQYPTGQGYDVNLSGCDYGQPPSYFDPFNQPKNRDEMLRAGIPFLPGRKPGEFLTHREGDEAVKLIRQWKDRPFFLQVAHYSVHTPIQAIDSVAAKYRREDKQDVNAEIRGVS